MNTSPPSSKVIETRYVWGRNIEECMEMAHAMMANGWVIEGNPAPMVFEGRHGTGISICKVING